MIREIILILFLALIFVNCSNNESEIVIELENPLDIPRTDAIIEVDLKRINNNSSFSTFIIEHNEKEIPYQIIGDREEEKVIFAMNFLPKEKIRVNVMGMKDDKPEYKSRTYAELAMKPGENIVDGKFKGDEFINVTKIKVPAIHKDHDALFKYEGPGWESEKVGYRYYLDWRNAIDIFGKKVNELVLHKVGVNDTVAQDDSYHEMQDWGMDIFKVGSSLGIGSIAMFDNDKVNMVSETDSIYCEISKNGPIVSEVKTNYYGWKVGENKYNLESRLSITAGSRLTKSDIIIDGNPSNIVTGLAKSENTKFLQKEVDNGWTYIALYGKQTLANDNLGIALFYDKKDLIEIREDDLSHVILLKPSLNKITYYFCAAWEKEPQGIKSENEFISYLDNKLNELNNQIEVEINRLK